MKPRLILMLGLALFCQLSVQAQQIQVHIESADSSGWSFRGAIPSANILAGAEANLAEAMSNYTAPAFQMADFSAEATRGVYEINWTSASPRQAFRIYVQRSPDGISWSEIGSFVGHPDQMPLQDWVYADAHPMDGPNFYRLRQVTVDGRSVTSDIMVIEPCPGGFHKSYLFPHPGIFGTMVEFDLDEPKPVKIKLMDADGMELAIIYHEQSVAGKHKIEVDVTDLPSGTYYCMIEVDGEVSKRVINR